MLSKNAQKIQDVLHQKQIETTVLELPSSTRTAQEAAATIGCEVAHIVKSLIFRTKETKKPVLVLASGVNRVQEKVIEEHLQEKLEKADADFVKEVTGFAIGGVPPLGHSQQLITFIDKDLLMYITVWAAAGMPFAVFSIDPSALEKVTNGTLVTF